MKLNIFSLGKYLSSGPIYYYPFGNSILSIRSSSNKNKIGASLLYQFFGLNVKKTNCEHHLDQFYGSEKQSNHLLDWTEVAF